MLRPFFRANIALCDRIERALPRRFTRSLLYLHELTAAELMNTRPAQVVVDVGGGHLCPVARHRRADLGTRILAIDVLESQLRRNAVADERVVADACHPLPLRDGAADLVVTRSVLEHLPETRGFLAECARILRPGGFMVHVFPGRFAPFAVLNRILPNAVVRSLLGYFFPKWVDECGFRAFYRDCYYPKVVENFGSDELTLHALHLRYYQSIYFKFFVPLYLVFLLYDLVLWAADARLLASQVLIVAQKAGSAAPPP